MKSERANNYAQALRLDFFLEIDLINHNCVSKSYEGSLTP